MIREIFIINQSGIGIFYQNFEKEAQYDEDLMSSYLSAIQALAVESTKDRIQAIISGSSRYSFVPGENFLMVIKTVKDMRDKGLLVKLNTMKSIFFQIYEEELKRKDANLEKYNGFENIIREIFNIDFKTKRKSSDLITNLLGLPLKKKHLKKLIDSL